MLEIIKKLYTLYIYGYDESILIELRVIAETDVLLFQREI